MYLGLWTIAIGIIAIVCVIALGHGFWIGLAAFAAYFIAAHFALKLIGHRAGIFDPNI